jgi:transcriptional regulator with XRE-family HTH domain
MPLSKKSILQARPINKVVGSPRSAEGPVSLAQLLEPMKPAQIGVENAIRVQRTQKGVSLRGLASRLGISASQLSKIETGKSKLSVELALKIAELLGVPAAVFLSKGKPSASGRRTISRADSTTVHVTAGMRLRPMCSEFKDNDTLYWTVTLSARTLEENGGWRQHPGQEFFSVLSGEVTLLSQLYEPVTLKVGDGILFDSDQPHAYLCGEEPAQVLMINRIT